MATQIPHFMGGRLAAGTSDRPVLNPAAGEQTGEVALTGARATTPTTSTSWPARSAPGPFPPILNTAG